MNVILHGLFLPSVPSSNTGTKPKTTTTKKHYSVKWVKNSRIQTFDIGLSLTCPSFNRDTNITYLSYKTIQGKLNSCLFSLIYNPFEMCVQLK